MATVVTLINRTSKTLIGTADGKHINITPGKHSFPEPMAKLYQAQNPRMGSENYFNPDDKIYLLGIEEHGDDCSPIEQSDALERFDRRQLGGEAMKAEVVPSRGGMFNRKSSDFKEQPAQSSVFQKA